MTSISGASVRLPSISELTARSPLHEDSQLSPRVKELPNLSSAGLSFKHPIKPTSPSNYVAQAPVENVHNVHKLPSLYYEKPKSASSTSSSPSSHYQYYPYHQPTPNQPIQNQTPVQVQTPISQTPAVQTPVAAPHNPAAPAPLVGYTTSPTSYYHQPVYYPPQVGPYSMSQYVVPEVINKPTNKCHRCGTTETPEWRRGPNGVRTLCNACGLFHAKLVKRKGAALAAEEVLNNKVCKGKNGRRISLKKHLLNESLLKNGPENNTIKLQQHQHQHQPQYQVPVPVATLPLPAPMYSHQNVGYHHIPQHSGYSHLMPLVRH